jgi:hypothetical protein
MYTTSEKSCFEIWAGIDCQGLRIACLYFGTRQRAAVLCNLLPQRPLPLACTTHAHASFSLQPTACFCCSRCNAWIPEPVLQH